MEGDRGQGSSLVMGHRGGGAAPAMFNLLGCNCLMHQYSTTFWEVYSRMAAALWLVGCCNLPVYSSLVYQPESSGHMAQVSAFIIN